MAQLSATISERNKKRLEDEAEEQKRSISGQIDYILDQRYGDGDT